MRAFMVSVDYTDLLSITLPYNRHHFGEVYVITSVHDAINVEKVCRENRAHMIVTDLFTARGASFNKWAALEHALDIAGRYGWMCLMDADVLWPQGVGTMETDKDLCVHFGGSWSMEKGQLCTPLRRMLTDLNTRVEGGWDIFPAEEHWKNYPVHRNVAEWAGYSQIFHADDPVLGEPPWHDVDWRHAGGADSFFQAKWPVECKVRPPFECLHLGDAGLNWFGRATPYLDGSKHPQAEVRAVRVRELWRGRLGKVGEERFAGEKLTESGNDLAKPCNDLTPLAPTHQALLSHPAQDCAGDTQTPQDSPTP